MNSKIRYKFKNEKELKILMEAFGLFEKHISLSSKDKYAILINKETSALKIENETYGSRSGKFIIIKNKETEKSFIEIIDYIPETETLYFSIDKTQFELIISFEFIKHLLLSN